MFWISQVSSSSLKLSKTQTHRPFVSWKQSAFLSNKLIVRRAKEILHLEISNIIGFDLLKEVHKNANLQISFPWRPIPTKKQDSFEIHCNYHNYQQVSLPMVIIKES